MADASKNDGKLTTQDMHATGGDAGKVTTKDMHATGGEASTDDMHATSEPAN
ncbi:hypothetical protein [Streptomyces sp. NRRL WC-3549]|uniref:hypothetical protein n=1 Tax=Streptomyces sp. NRRL WC-3549 TaxID=1463925 RepID=UPI000A3E5EB4|nr:hypothetical protein [Streptomyces sp. NRRL WC-3549]